MNSVVQRVSIVLSRVSRLIVPLPAGTFRRASGYQEVPGQGQKHRQERSEDRTKESTGCWKERCQGREAELTWQAKESLEVI